MPQEGALIAPGPDYDRIQLGDGVATREAVFLVWATLQLEIQRRQAAITQVEDEADWISLMGGI